MHRCERCKITYRNPRCPKCGDRPDTFVSDPPASVGTDEQMVAQFAKANRPTLAELVRRGLKAGYIKTVAAYGNWDKKTN